MGTQQGEILFRELYGASTKERCYVQPAEQLKVVMLNDGQHSDVSGILARIFLPQGYPDSVSKDYFAYQIWDTAQAFCSTITGTLATQEVLRGVGVGNTASTPLAATIVWVIKDGCGHLGRILFAYSHGSSLDSYSKKWRLYADTLNDAAMCIEIALPLFGGYTTFALCVSTVMKSIVGVAGKTESLSLD
ncbi:jg18845 [Pararge aegeria aegeria]|uniref:Jg18845 protein n=1 Tax=Pararge aegeria aegeria TaxID=348720 RepID=A0A8S4R4H0_9NEOP|nr:jg18845 [Pararge aegeria aegeria]